MQHLQREFRLHGYGVPELQASLFVPRIQEAVRWKMTDLGIRGRSASKTPAYALAPPALE
jgi:hypothetical protein